MLKNDLRSRVILTRKENKIYGTDKKLHFDGIETELVHETKFLGVISLQDIRIKVHQSLKKKSTNTTFTLI